MSVEINSDSVGMSDGMYWSRQLWSDGTAGGREKADCNNTGNHPAAVKFFVQGTGYHQTLVSEVILRRHQKVSNPNPAASSSTLGKQCNLAVVYTMETGQYMDLDELREARPYSGVAAKSGTWSIDVEKPSEQSTRHVVALRMTGCPSDRFVADRASSELRHLFQTPVHFRYQRVQSELTAAPSCLLPPLVFVRCSHACSGEGGDEKEQLPNEGGSWELIEDVVVDYGVVDTSVVSDRTSTRICRSVPVGNEKDMVMVSYLTAVLTFAGAFSIWYSSM
jgi:hypothetical protein